ncbi:MAG: AmmeMemoRadiSam system radical SAM enzyme [Candidatus Aenigmarchaeota archaeon]|nr:AmmeMemoRadiSam system radical SAM enzyme [Candidatus Aenigmarchaeota archaeon]
MKEALFYSKMAADKVRCVLCPRFCIIQDGKTGACGVRKNHAGTLYSMVYGKLCSLHIDPIEKKPLFHFAPGTECLSIATVGCNLTCLFCQNWEISHPENPEHIVSEEMAPEKIIALAKEYKLPGIAYTYTEPTVFFEYALDVMRLAREEGLYNVWVSNGYTNPEPAKKAAKFLDAVNVDLKGDGIFYKRLCGIPNEDPIRESLKIYKKAGVWIEVTTLLIPGYNDSEKTITGIVEWVKENLGVDTPMHFSRFYPQYKLMNAEPTPVKTIEEAVKIAEKLGMHYVYAGNIYAHDKESTHCPKCHRKVIDRVGYHISKIRNKCPDCGTGIAIAGGKWAKL